MKIKRNDIILIALFLIIAMGIMAFLSITRTDGAIVTVKVNNEIVGTYSLNEDITVQIGDNNYNVLVIENGKARISEASCPDLLCVNQKAISYNGESIICLPNKVVVEIIGNESSDIDAVAN